MITKLTQDFISKNKSDYYIYDRIIMSKDQLESMNNFIMKNKIRLYIIEIEIPKEIALECMKLRSREDDTQENREARLEKYFSVNRFLLKDLVGVESLYRINGENSTQEVFTEVYGVIRNIMNSNI